MSNFNFKPSSFRMRKVLSAQSERAVVGYVCPVSMEGNVETFLVTENEENLKKIVRGLLGDDYPFSDETIRRVVMMPDDDADIIT